MMCFEADLQLVRASPADGKSGLSASRWALTEAAIIADISAALEEDLDSGDEFSVSADDGPDIICDERHTDDGPDTFDELHNRGQSSSTQLAVVETEAGPSGGPLATVDSSLIAPSNN